ncbi:hypothetical protein [Nocardioides sp.]|uniref:hypothetical protein n=1 Tax=Nocardioides sp. TaxID=35761 RepID=UPI0025D5F2CF|nr:hypothetical protein [Nocardioides sp.]
MRLTPRQLNRTLLQRQHLLERVGLSPHAVVAHLLTPEDALELRPAGGLDNEVARVEGPLSA